jgi:hypothetical protein
MAAFAWFILLPFQSKVVLFLIRDNVPKNIEKIEIALERLRADSRCDDMRKLFDANVFARRCEELAVRSNLNAFEASTKIYTVTATALLRHGSHAAEALSASDQTKDLAEVLNKDALVLLSEKYLDVKSDLWGTPFHFFVGPWPEHWGPIVFRTYQDEGEGATPDVLTVDWSRDGGTVRRLGFPPSLSAVVYVWSYGSNRISDQACFDPSGKYEPPSSRHYRPGASVDYMGGGDDINNWDKSESSYVLYHSLPDYRIVWEFIRSRTVSKSQMIDEGSPSSD